MNALTQRLGEFWKARAPREQRAIVLMMVIVGLALSIQLFWTAWHQRDALRRQVPLRQMEVAILEQQAKALATPVSKATINTVAGNALEQALRQEIKSISANLSLRMLGTRQVELRGDADFDPLVTWLGKVQTEYGLRVRTAEFAPTNDRRDGHDGRVTLVVELGAE